MDSSRRIIGYRIYFKDSKRGYKIGAVTNEKYKHCLPTWLILVPSDG